MASEKIRHHEFLFIEHVRWLLCVLKDRHLTYDEQRAFRASGWMFVAETDIEAIVRPVADAVRGGEPVPLVMPNIEEIEKAYVDAVRAWRAKYTVVTKALRAASEATPMRPA